MENKNIKIRINLEKREFEVDGDSSYIMDTFGTDIREYIEMLKSNAEKGRSENNNILRSSNTNVVVSTSQGQQNEWIADSFGEYFNKFPKNLTIVDKLLIACYYLQSTQESKCFTIKEASDILIEQGVKLSNSNAFNKSNLSTKRVFKLTGRSFKVSDSGVEYIKGLLSI